jgi:tetratricopeptide (TPR) repeat protein
MRAVLRRHWSVIGIGLGGLVLLGLVCGAVWAWEVRRLHTALEQAKRDLAAGRYARAHRALAELAAQWPADGEVAYQLGLCQQARGRTDAALAAWARVPTDSPFAGWAAARRARVEMSRGRLAAAEALLIQSLEHPGSHRDEARWGLVLLLREQGRFAEARRLYLAGIDLARDAVPTLVELYKLDHDPFPTEGVRQAMESAARQAPDDDRVWLARAHLATRLGQFTEADRWLGACLQRRPDDPVVWRARLEWAMAAGQPEVARQALEHIPADPDPDVPLATLRAWFAQQAGDRTAEQAAWQRLHELDPGDLKALDRLAELATAAGQTAQAARLRRRRLELEETDEAYTRLLTGENAMSHAEELARLARDLGRRTDAAIWSYLAATAANPGRRAVALPQLVPAASPARRMLADLLPDLHTAPRPTAPSPPATAIAAAGAGPWFVDDAAGAGLQFVHHNGWEMARLIPPASASGGVGLLDYDGDGWLDVYVVQGGPFPAGPQAPRDGDRLFRNRGDGSFEDVTEQAGIAGRVRGYGHGVAVADFDNDGRPDVFLTRWHAYVLLRNRGDGRFEDVTERAGLAGDRDWPTSAAFADFDQDGDLDLYVCHYLSWDVHDHPVCVDPRDPATYHCHPRDFPALPDRVFRNDGGRFVDATADAGLVDPDGRGLGVVAADLDDDGKVDLYVANDGTANYLLHNRGGFHFEERALDAGAAASGSGLFQAGMGVACGDLDGDGRVDLAVTNFYNESTSFFRNLGGGRFGEQGDAIGVGPPSRYLLGWGIAFPDVNNDGRLDLMTANGHIYDARPQLPFTMPVQLLLGGGDGRLTDVSRQAGPPFQSLHLGRGLAAGDLDNDGRVDALVVAQNEPLIYLHNQTRAGHFVVLRLEGTTSNRDAVGARVTLAAGGRRLVAQRIGGGSYQSASDPRLHFGLAGATRVETLEVRWPSGRVDRYRDLAADAAYHLREGNPRAMPLKGWREPESPIRTAPAAFPNRPEIVPPPRAAEIRKISVGSP